MPSAPGRYVLQKRPEGRTRWKKSDRSRRASLRRAIVAGVREGQSQRAVARAHNVSLATVQLWVGRARDQALDEIVWTDRSSVPQRTTRTPPELEGLILRVRGELRTRSVLGEYGPHAVRAALRERLGPAAELPSLRTIARVAARAGEVDFRRRRAPAPPPGWYLPEVRVRQAELDSFDTIEGLRLAAGPDLTILTGISVHGGLPVAWPRRALTVRGTVHALLEHWRDVGLPGYAQFDNDPRFAGGPGQTDAIGPVIRLCLRLGIVSVFAPPREHGFQNAIEGFNGRWQAKLWSRFQEATLSELDSASVRYVATLRQRGRARIDAAPPRRPFPGAAELELEVPLSGRIIYLRRMNDAGQAVVLGRQIVVDRRLPHRLVRADVDLDDRVIRFFGLHRRDPGHMPLLRELPYLPHWMR